MILISGEVCYFSASEGLLGMHHGKQKRGKVIKQTQIFNLTDMSAHGRKQVHRAMRCKLPCHHPIDKHNFCMRDANLVCNLIRA